MLMSKICGRGSVNTIVVVYIDKKLCGVAYLDVKIARCLFQSLNIFSEVLNTLHLHFLLALTLIHSLLQPTVLLILNICLLGYFIMFFPQSQPVETKLMRPLNTEREWNVHKMLRRRPLNILCTFNLRPVFSELESWKYVLK